VQRVAMVMFQNRIRHQRTDIELDNKPDWFTKQCPTQNVPLLIIDDDKTLFEADAICRYLDALMWKSLFPVDAYVMALHHSAMAIGEKILSLTADLIYRDLSEEIVDATLHQIHKQFAIVSRLITPSPLAQDSDLTLLDMVFATVFRPLPLISVGLNRDLCAGFADLRGWATDLAANRTVISAVPSSYFAEMHEFISRKNGYLAHRLRAIPADGLELKNVGECNVVSL
jgi:glutathione S-transferase